MSTPLPHQSPKSPEAYIVPEPIPFKPWTGMLAARTVEDSVRLAFERIAAEMNADRNGAK